jgi:hypothetical protein
MNRQSLAVAIVLVVAVLVLGRRNTDMPEVSLVRAPLVPQSFQPLILNTCETVSSKRGLAWGGRSIDPLADQRLCLRSGALSTSWDAIGGIFGARNLIDLPMLWGRHWTDGTSALQHWEDNTPRNYKGIVLGPNECDRPDQCNLPVNEVALLMVEAMAWCPNCRWITPSWSMARQCEELPAFVQYLKIYGVDLSRFIGIGLHVYSWHWGLNVDAIFDRCDDIMPDEFAELSYWVTEAGVLACDNTYPEMIESAVSDLLTALNERGDVTRYMVYSPYHQRTKFCDFVPFFDWNTHETTPVGWVMAR